MRTTIRSRPLTIDATTRLPATVGDTPIVFIDEPFTTGGRGYWAKLEGANPGGIKDRSALHMVRRARERGELRAGARIVESTSGTLGLGQVTAWCRRRWGPGRSIVLGLATMGSAFFPMLAADTLPSGPNGTTRLAIGVIALVVTSALLGIGTAIVFPFEMDTIISLSHGRLVATHYGLYNTVCGAGIMLGNLGIGWASRSQPPTG